MCGIKKDDMAGSAETMLISPTVSLTMIFKKCNGKSVLCSL